MIRSYHLHLVSDATGETTHSIARACLVQFDGIEVVEHMWPMVRSRAKAERVITGIEENPGAVIFTLIDARISAYLVQECARLRVPCISVLDGVMSGLASYFGTRIRGQPGRQHLLDDHYFGRIEAMNFVLGHDDGQAIWDLNRADVILVGVSRTSKTPTSIYLANHRGIKAANIPFVPGVALPKELFAVDRPFIVGLTATPERLVQIRRNRLHMLGQTAETDYVDPRQVRREIVEARKLFTRMRWPVIDVTRRSIEETAAAILELYGAHREVQAPDAAVEP